MRIFSQCIFPLLVVLAAALAVGPTRALAQSEEKGKEEALAIYQEAVDLAKQQQWEKALELFQQAAEKGAPPVVHYNMGRCLESLGRFEEAAASYKKYLEDPSATDREKIEGQIKMLFEKPSVITIESTPGEADVIEKLEGSEKELGKTPFTQTFPAGKHVLALRKKGFKGKILKISAGYGKVIHINTPLEPSPQQAPGAAAAPTPPSPIGLVLGVGGGVSVHLYKSVDPSAGGNFDLDIHKILGSGRLQYGAGVVLAGSFYAIEDFSGGTWRSMFIDAMVQGQLRYSFTERLTLVTALPLGVSFLIPVEEIPSSANLKILGGRIEGGSLPFFTFGLSAALRVDIISGFHILLRPVEVLVLVPLKETYGGNKVLPRYGATVFLAWEF
jgi:hypothetical protein